MMNLFATKKVFIEDRDCGADLELSDTNTITLETVSNGIGHYVVISTDRWAVDEDSLMELFHQIKQMQDEVNV